MGRPQTPLKETALEPWTQPQVGWNNFSDNVFSVRVASVSCNRINLGFERNAATGGSVVLGIVCQNDLFWCLAAQTIGSVLLVEVSAFFLREKCQDYLAFSLCALCA